MVNTSKIGTSELFGGNKWTTQICTHRTSGVRDVRSIPIPVAEPTSTDAVEVDIPDMETPLSITEQTSKYLEVPL